MRYLQKALKIKNPSSLDIITYELYGFPLVFQVWAYETISTLGENYAERIRNKIHRGTKLVQLKKDHS